MTVIVRKANALNPNGTACREDEILQGKMNAILKHFLRLKIFSPPSCDKALEQYTQFLEEIKGVNSHKLRHFKTWETSPDDFYFKKLDADIRRCNKFLSGFKII